MARHLATVYKVLDSLGGEVTELLQQLIRNSCVNDGTLESGHEQRSEAVLRSYLQGANLDLESYEPAPGRTSLVGRIEGRDPAAPTMCLMGHTDVVPVTPAAWREDPFGGELIDGEVWGRGAIDMLNLTASMAVAVRHLADEGFRPAGTLIYLAAADEESGGEHGAGWLTDHAWDAVGADYVLTESGGVLSPTPAGPKLSVTVAEKGMAWRRLRMRGTPGHGSTPFGSKNAIVIAAEVVRRIAAYRPRPQISELWRSWVDNMVIDNELRAALLDPQLVWDACAAQPDVRAAKYWHACTHTTFSPDVIVGGTTTNVVADLVDLDVDVRTLPGETADDVRRHLDAALGDMAEQVEILTLNNVLASASPIDTPMWSAIERAARAAYPDAELLPRTAVGGTDAKYFRGYGTVVYGWGLMSPRVTYEDFASRFHGNNERIDVESLALSTEMWLNLAHDFLA